MNIHSNVRMSEQQYDAERSKVAQTKQEAQQQAGVRWEQQLAILFYRSGWTQEELANKEKKSRFWVIKLTLFGRFLNFVSNDTNVGTLPNNLGEGRFRSYWRRTEGRMQSNERIRFKQVIEMMREDTTLSRPHAKLNHGLKIKEKFGDGKWHAEETLARALNIPRPEIARSLDLMCQKGSYGAKAERKKIGSSFHYRIFPQEKMISVAELIEKLTPIVKGLMQEGKKNMATMSPPTVAHLAGLLQNLLDEWAE